MGHLRPKLRIRDRVCRVDDPRHIGIVLRTFKSKEGEWFADVRWLDHGIKEYVPMNELVHEQEKNND
jgi:hypothetical protein